MSTELFSPAQSAPSASDVQLFNKPAAKKFPVESFGYPRDFLGQRFVYLTISPRARGLSIGINLNPDAGCTFDCLYCEVDRSRPRPDSIIECAVARKELEQTLSLVQSGSISNYAPYSNLPRELLSLRHVALSGDGEPTISPRFLEVVETVVHVRARGAFPFFKIVLITNGSHLDSPEVQAGLSLLTARDEIWAKLDAGTQAHLERLDRPTVSLQKIFSNILETARKRPVIIQSLFCAVDGQTPTASEITEFASRLKELKEAGANIPLVQVYSATRPVASKRVEHLPLLMMREIAATVRNVAGLRAEVF